jgi:hypothetical protein
MQDFARNYRLGVRVAPQAADSSTRNLLPVETGSQARPEQPGAEISNFECVTQRDMKTSARPDKFSPLRLRQTPSWTAVARGIG